MKKLLLAVAIVALISNRASAVLIVNDNFDSYTSTTDFTAAWPVLAGGGATISTTQSVSAPNSVKFDASPATQRNQKIVTETGVPSATNTIRFSFDFYDSNAAVAPYRQQHNLQDGTAPTSSGQLVSMGLNNNLTSAAQGGNYYMARILGGAANGGAASAYFKLNDPGAPLRSTGWHNLRVDITPAAFTFFVDGILSETVANTFTLRSYEVIRIGSGVTSTHESFIDNVRLETIDPTAAVPEPGSFAAIGLVGLISAAAVWINKRRAERAVS
jgi:hypothetical protein